MRFERFMKEIGLACMMCFFSPRWMEWILSCPILSYPSYWGIREFGIKLLSNSTVCSLRPTLHPLPNGFRGSSTNYLLSSSPTRSKYGSIYAASSGWCTQRLSSAVYQGPIHNGCLVTSKSKSKGGPIPVPDAVRISNAQVTVPAWSSKFLLGEKKRKKKNVRWRCWWWWWWWLIGGFGWRVFPGWIFFFFFFAVELGARYIGATARVRVRVNEYTALHIATPLKLWF